MKLRPVIPFLLIIICLSCTEKPRESASKAKQAPEASLLPLEVSSNQFNQGLKITGLTADSSHLISGTHGLTISFDVEVKSEAFTPLKAEKYTSYFIDLKCITPDGKSFLLRDELFKNSDKKKFIHVNRDCFISQPTVRHIDATFPYRFLQMSKGLKDLTIEINAFPAKFKDDSTELNMRELKNISNTPTGSLRFNLKVNAPQLFQTSFTVYKAKVNTTLKKPEKYDVALTGNGYPDLFWEVYCGNDYIYYSPVEKNKIEYLKKYTSSTFYCTSDDVINIALVDFDNGPFNTQDDIIGTWKTKISELHSDHKDTITFDKVESMVIESHFKEELFEGGNKNKLLK